MSTKKQREIVHRMYSGNSGRKLFIILTIILNIALIAFLIIGLVGYIYGEPVFELFELNGNEITGLTPAGLASFIIACAVLVFDIISVVVVLTIKSSKKVASEVAETVF